jgi:hypothetical protein
MLFQSRSLATAVPLAPLFLLWANMPHYLQYSTVCFVCLIQLNVTSWSVILCIKYVRYAFLYTCHFAESKILSFASHFEWQHYDLQETVKIFIVHAVLPACYSSMSTYICYTICNAEYILLLLNCVFPWQTSNLLSLLSACLIQYRCVV